jgi:hypothetical protein
MKRQGHHMSEITSAEASKEQPTTDQGTTPTPHQTRSTASLVLADHSVIQRVVGNFRVHEAAEVIPTLAGDAFEAFVTEIKENGQREPVVVIGDVLIEGVDTAKAVGVLKERGVDIDLQTVEWQPRPGQTVPEFLAYKLLQGPRYTDAQRAQIALDLQPLIEKERAAAQEAARIKPGEVRNPLGINKHIGAEDGERETHPPADEKARNKAKRERSTVGRLARLANVSEYAVRKAQQIKQIASPADLAAVKDGTMRPKDVIPKVPPPTGPNKPAAKSSKPSDHPFTPTTELQRDLLTGWVRLRENKVAVNEREQARVDMRLILDAEEKADQVPPKPRQPGAAGSRKSAPNEEASK